MGTTHTVSKNLGGDRLGSGSKNRVTMHNYNRSNHDLSYAWRSTMNVGTLVPFCKLIEENGDSWQIDINAVAKTIPTIAPLFGAFKLQIDVFECPIRLYNGLLHNNMTKIGLNMAAVKLPKCTYKTKVLDPETTTEDPRLSQISPSSLVAYLGLSGIIDYRGDYENGEATVTRKLQCIPTLAYWDIYKNYYANKQEEKGVVITKDPYTYASSLQTLNELNYMETQIIRTVDALPGSASELPESLVNPASDYQTIYGEQIQRDWLVDNNPWQLIFAGRIGRDIYAVVENDIVTLETIWNDVDIQATNSGTVVTMKNATGGMVGEKIYGFCYNSQTSYNATTKLQEFDLKNIDDARIAILQNTGLNNELQLENECNYLPYSTTFNLDDNGFTLNKYAQNGLGIKTYQSDLLQNWLSTEWIDGENGINAITAVDTSSGSFQIDALNLANKVYNMLNRIAVSGGTYEDWQEAVFTSNVNRRAETPVYKGGYAAEICFDEVISTAATQDKPLGTLAGRAIMPKEGIRGGKIEISCDEPAYIIGIVSITPRVDYSQGNDWDITELDTMDDLHKPALDGIGFEDLLQERAAWWGTYTIDGDNITKLAMGKTTAWINYQTAINKCYGGFAIPLDSMYMTLNRQYEYSTEVKGIADLTTYIDPSKYNYAFAQQDLEAQNFWVQIGMRITSRRVMSARILPNL